jgi:CRP/FNR family cyclic AMP-dependent transcriptional regulator
MDPVTVDHLRAIGLFASLDDGALAAVAERATEVEVSAGRVLIEVGQPGTGLFVVLDGTLVVELPGGRAVELGTGQFVGDIALLTDRPHIARVRAKTHVRCLAIGRAGFAALLRESPQIAVAMLPTLAERVADLP